MKGVQGGWRAAEGRVRGGNAACINTVCYIQQNRSMGSNSRSQIVRWSPLILMYWKSYCHSSLFWQYWLVTRGKCQMILIYMAIKQTWGIDFRLPPYYTPPYLMSLIFAFVSFLQMRSCSWTAVPSVLLTSPLTSRSSLPSFQVTLLCLSLSICFFFLLILP